MDDTSTCYRCGQPEEPGSGERPELCPACEAEGSAVVRALAGQYVAQHAHPSAGEFMARMEPRLRGSPLAEVLARLP